MLKRIHLIVVTFRHLAFNLLIVLPLYCVFAIAEKIDERRQ
ncbi:hypothetical protein ACODT5_00755 [Streptomyces sp. 5.8]